MKDAKSKGETGHNPPPPPPPPDQANVRKVTLARGGTITLSVDVDLFELGEEDRKFVVGLVDAVRAYAQAHPEGANKTAP